MPEKGEIAQRLEQWCAKHYSRLTKAAKGLNVNYAQLFKYVDGTTLPGTKFLLRFHEAGGNVVWLITGEGNMDRVSGHGEPGHDLGALAQVIGSINPISPEDLIGEEVGEKSDSIVIQRHDDQPVDISEIELGAAQLLQKIQRFKKTLSEGRR